MKNLAIIGASYLQLPLIKKAKEMGYSTHVFAWEANDVGEKEADFFYPISIIEVEKITEKCKEIGICGICSIATDLGNFTVNYVANKLGLPGNNMDSVKKSTNKYLMRVAFEQNEDPSPKYIVVNSNTVLDSLKLSYPVIVKPTDRSGSRGIIKIKDERFLKEAVEFAINEGFEKKALIEEFVEGEEYSVEGISFNGAHHILAITKKYTTGEPNFIETGHMEPANIDNTTNDKIIKIVTHALDSLEIKNSASHSEIKIDDNGNIKIIEIGSRMGGDCIGSHLVYYSTGIDFLKAVIQVACGIEPDLTPKINPFPAMVKFIITENDVIEMRKAMETDKFVDLIAFYPENIGRTTNSSNRAGCYIMKTDFS